MDADEPGTFEINTFADCATEIWPRSCPPVLVPRCFTLSRFMLASCQRLHRASQDSGSVMHSRCHPLPSTALGASLVRAERDFVAYRLTAPLCHLQLQVFELMPFRPSGLVLTLIQHNDQCVCIKRKGRSHQTLICWDYPTP